jgi:putative DNA primase/helicase
MGILDDAERRLANIDKARAKWERNKGNGKGKHSDIAGARAIVVRGDSIAPESISWVWPGWLGRGMVHILAGAPGCGKTTIALGLAAVITTAGSWPDGVRQERVGNVLIWTGEDIVSKAIIPRLLAAGADCSHTHILTGVEEPGEGIREFIPSIDLPLLLDAARKIPDLDLVVIDPMIASVSGDAHKNVEVRRALQPLVTLAEERGCAVWGLTHFTKGTAGKDPVDRVTGSVAFGALARVVMAAARIRDQDDGDERRVFCRAKSNNGPDTGGWEYSMVVSSVPGKPDMEAIVVAWGEPLEGAARELLDQPEQKSDGANRRKGAFERAEAFLIKALSGGDLSVGMVRELWEREGSRPGWRTIETAKKALGITSRKDHSAVGGWLWRMPEG